MTAFGLFCVRPGYVLILCDGYNPHALDCLCVVLVVLVFRLLSMFVDISGFPRRKFDAPRRGRPQMPTSLPVRV